MKICSSVIFFLIITQETLQNCVPVNIFNRFYTRFATKKYVHCEKVVISSDFHKQIESLQVEPEYLQINNTDSPEIVPGAFSNLNRLPDLRINGASVQVIQPGSFEGLNALNHLSLKDNKISTIKEHYFIKLTKLLTLDLSFNNIANIEEKSFVYLTNLQRVILQNNVLTKLSPNLFRFQTRVDTLDLSFNKLSTADDQLLTNLTNLRILSLNNNNLKSLDSKMVSNNVRLQNFYINNNQITKLYNFTLSNSLEILNVSHNLIQFLNFSMYTKLNVIDLRGNGIMNMDKFLLKNVAVKSMYLDQNFLGLSPFDSKTFSNLSSLEVISLSNNQIKQLNPDLFENNTRLTGLNVAKNYLQSKDFLNLPISLQNLDLNSNQFDSSLNLTGLINLLYLDISFNNLTQVSFKFLGGLKTLTRLKLNNNKIEKINLGCFRDLKMLREIDLSFNQIAILEMGVFVGLDNLFRLDLSHNKLNVLNEGVFHNLRYLQFLNLSYNNVGYSGVEDTLTHLTWLREIGLAGNGWPCSSLTTIIKEFKKTRLTNGGDYMTTNVDGITCKYEVKDSTHLIELETENFSSVNSKFNTVITLLVLILLLVVIKLCLKYLLRYCRNGKLKDRLRREKCEQELQLVNDC